LRVASPIDNIKSGDLEAIVNMKYPFVLYFVLCFGIGAQVAGADRVAESAPAQIVFRLQGALPSAKTPARVYLYPVPAGVAGTVAWTIAGGHSKTRASDEGLYIARIGADSSRAPQRFAFRVADKPERVREYNQGDASGLGVAPDGEQVVFGSEPEIHQEYSPDFGIELSSLSELDLATGKSRVLIEAKENRSNFSWSLDGRFLSYDGTEWRFPYEQPGLGLSFEMSYPQSVLDLQTLRFVNRKTQLFRRADPWTRGNRTVRVDVDVDEYSDPGQRRSARVTVSNRLRSADKNVFQLQGQQVVKTHKHKVRQIIEPLGLSADGRYLFVRYGESDALENQYGPLDITDQGIFAVDLKTRRAHLLAAFKNAADVAWRAR